MIYSRSVMAKLLALLSLCLGARAFQLATRSSSSATAGLTSLSMAQMTKFERMKQKWKGLTPVRPSEEEVGASYEEFEKGLEEATMNVQFGDVIKGYVHEFMHSGALVEIGAKASAYMPEIEYSLLPCEDPQSVLGLGEDHELEFKVISNENAEGQFRLSVRRLQIDRAWDEMVKLEAEGAMIEITIAGVNRGGCIVTAENGLRGFMPGSHVVNGPAKEEDIGKKLSVKFLGLQREENNFLVSQRLALMEQSRALFEEGKLVSGKVVNVKPYGVFVDCYGVVSLLHISQISSRKITDLEAIFHAGMAVTCVVFENDPAKQKIALTTRPLEAEAGDMLADPAACFARAEENYAAYKERQAAAEAARAAAAAEVADGLQRAAGLFDDDDEEDGFQQRAAGLLDDDDEEDAAAAAEGSDVENELIITAA